MRAFIGILVATTIISSIAILQPAAAASDIDGISGASYEMPPSVPREDSAIRSDILEWLQKHWLMTVATADPDGAPHVSGVVYYSHGSTVFFVSKRESNKIRNLLHDPRVAYTVWDPVDSITKLKALQVRGRARILEGEERENASRRFAGYPFDAEYAVVEITPVTARWTDRSRPAEYTHVVDFSDEMPSIPGD